MLKGWRTIAVNALATILPILSLSEWVDVMPKEWVPWYALTLALANMALRMVTTTPVGRRE